MNSGRNVLGDRPEGQRFNPELNAWLIERYGKGYVPPKQPEAEAKANTSDEVQARPQIISAGDFWRIGGVEYNAGTYTVDLSKFLLLGGASKTFLGWAEFSQEARAQDDFYVPDMLLAHAVFKAWYNQRDRPEAEEVRDFLKTSMRNHWLTTLTKVEYQSVNNRLSDWVTHGARISSGSFVGASGESVTRVESRTLQVILGDRDPNEINKVYQWINGTGASLWRVDSRGDKVKTMFVDFDADSEGVCINAGRHTSSRNPAFGVRIVESSLKNPRGGQS